MAVAFPVTVLSFVSASAQVAGEGRPLDAEVSGEVTSELAHLPPRHLRWLEEVALLLTPEEREVFVEMREGYQRDDFVRRFWRVRDPFPQTGRNELKESWEIRVAAARARFDDQLDRDRARWMLILGPPSKTDALSCSSLLRPLEIWTYAEGASVIDGAFTVVFVGAQARGKGVHRPWYPSQGLRPLLGLGTFGGRPFDDGRIATAIENDCPRGGMLLAGLSQAIELPEPERLLPRSPSAEWAQSLRARSTEVAADAVPLAAALRLSYPGRHQSRTILQGLIDVERAAATQVERGPYRGYQFLVDGEILRQNELFDRFRYRFDLPAEQVEGTGTLPLVVQRYLRPGGYTLILKVEDTASKHVFRQERSIDVPRVEARTIEVDAEGTVRVVDAGPVDAAADASGLGPAEARLVEANASIATGDHTVQLLPPPRELAIGKMRVAATTTGEGIARVAFELNGKKVMRKSRPPYSIELDLGTRPRLHTVRAIALDRDGTVLASDEIRVNAGPHSFSMRLIEPQPGRAYQRSVRARAEVEVPEGERFDRFELYLNETLLTTLYQPPFEQPILLPEDPGLAYVRAVAYLRDGNRAEDVVFINAPDITDELKVQFVELYTTVIDRRGDFVEGLTVDDFTVLEDGEAQDVRRFELVRDLPIHAGIVIDTSLSMIEELREVETAAYRFLETVITPRDRAAVITFNDAPTLAVRLTNDAEVLAGGLASLTAEGETALYDTVVFALHYFSGLRGKRAVVLLTDGEDSISRYSYEDALSYARASGVALYIIGLDLPTRSTEVRLRMRRLANETGGAFMTIEHTAQLGRVYERIQQELRAQYLLGYQSSQLVQDGFRRIEVDVEGRGREAKTIAGYEP